MGYFDNIAIKKYDKIAGKVLALEEKMKSARGE